MFAANTQPWGVATHRNSEYVLATTKVGCILNDAQEQAALRRLQRGEISGLATLVQMYQVKALRTAYLITGDHALAEDIVQAAFLRVYERIHQYDERRPFAPWFMRIVANDALLVLRRTRRLVALDTPLSETDTTSFADFLPTMEASPESELETAEMRAAVWQALEQLTPEQRTLIVLRYYGELSERELAEEMNAPKGTIKWRLHAARQRLRGLLGRFWQTDSDAIHRREAQR
jgi:RNA polymerase sigma-70 factor (ECF subfamily)